MFSILCPLIKYTEFNLPLLYVYTFERDSMLLLSIHGFIFTHQL